MMSYGKEFYVETEDQVNSRND